MRRPLSVAVAATALAAGALSFGVGPAAAATVSAPAGLAAVANTSTSAVRPDSGGGCTASLVEVCFGVNGTASDVNWMQVQVDTQIIGNITEWITGPDGSIYGSLSANGVAGWMPPLRVNVDQDVISGWYCGHASFDNDEVPDYCVLVS